MLLNYGNTALNDAAFSVFEPMLARYSISYPFSSSTKNRPLYFSTKHVKGKFQGAHPKLWIGWKSVHSIERAASYPCSWPKIEDFGRCMHHPLASKITERRQQGSSGWKSLLSWIGHYVSKETEPLLCWTMWKAAYNVFVGPMRGLLYISVDFHGPWRLQRWPELCWIMT